MGIVAQTILVYFLMILMFKNKGGYSVSEFNSNDVTIKLGLDIDENNLIASLNSVLNTANDISEKGLHIGFDTDGLQQTLNKVLKNGKIDVDTKTKKTKNHNACIIDCPF